MVENHELFAEVVVAQFLSEWAVIVCPSIAAARQQILRGRFDVVLVDYDLDDGKGDQFVRWLIRRALKVPIVAISAKQEGNTRLRNAGAHAVCSKTDFAMIRDRIREAVSGARSESEIE